ncbi:MAG: aldo/keto reductase [bacterium]|nr:aldo/keto reductase [bacterium]
MINKQQLSKIGIGTWGIGGFTEPDPQNDDEKQIDAIVYSINKGINYIETVYMYAKGKTVDLVSKAVKKSKVEREKIFITLSVYQSDAKTTKEVEQRLNSFLETFGMDYVDSLQLTMGLVHDLGLDSVAEFVDGLIKQGKTRYTSLANSNPDYLKKYHEAFKEKLFAHECCFNFEVRENETMGITEYAKQNGILNVIYQPLRRNRTANRNWPLLVKLAKKYGKTQNQILLNWIVSKGFFPLVKSSTKAHIDENLASFDFQIKPEDLKRLNEFKINYQAPKIDWFGTGNGVPIHQIPNIFDEEYEKQSKII